MDLQIICHFFYLPYENGHIAETFVKGFEWLKDNMIQFDREPPKEKVCVCDVKVAWPGKANQRNGLSRKLDQEKNSISMKDN